MSSRHAWLALVALGMLIFANTLGNPFVHDDVVFILQNPHVRTFTDLSQVFLRSSIAPPDIALANPYYRPLLDVLYKVEFLFFGASPAGYHIVNILLHIGNALLVFALLRKLSGREILSWGVVFLFLVHPVNTEAVACISGVSNLLSTFLCLVAFLFYLKLTEEGGVLELGQEALYFSGALVLFGLALLTKEQAIVLPALIILYEFCFSKTIVTRRTGWRLRLSGLFIVAGGYLLWRKLILGSFTTSLIANPGEFFLRLKSIPAMLLEHLRVLILPYDLHYYRSYDILAPWGLPFLSFLVVMVVFGAAYAFVPTKDKRLVGFGLGWFFISLLPTMIVPLIHEYSHIAQFEHFLYLPAIGLWLALFIIADYLAIRVFHQRAPVVKRAVCVVVIFAAGLVTVGQNRVWAGEVPLFEQAVHYEKSLGRVRLLLAKAYFSDKQTAKAQKQFLLCQNIMAGYLVKIRDERVRPFYQGFLKEGMLGEAACEERRGNLPAATQIYQSILRIFPEDQTALTNLGFIAVRLEKWDEAVLHFERDLAAHPADPYVLTNLGVCRIRQGELAKAEELFRRALAADPDFAPAKNNLEHLINEKSKR